MGLLIVVHVWRESGSKLHAIHSANGAIHTSMGQRPMIVAQLRGEG